VQRSLEIGLGARTDRAEAVQHDLAPGPGRAGPERQAFDAVGHDVEPLSGSLRRY
jgi:hypothetical protein